MLFRETVAVYCENRSELTDTLCGQNVELVNIEACKSRSKNVALLYSVPRHEWRYKHAHANSFTPGSLWIERFMSRSGRRGRGLELLCLLGTEPGLLEYAACTLVTTPPELSW
jgi:hypothetical protein